jgi:predicted kinase
MLYILCGLPFAGKTTLARRLAEILGAELVSLDAINAERGLGLDGRGVPPSEWAASYAEADRRISQALSVGRSVVSDAAHFTRAERDRARTIARRYSIETCVLYLPISASEAQQRLFANRGGRSRPDVRDADFWLVVTHFEPPDDESDVLPLLTRGR